MCSKGFPTFTQSKHQDWHFEQPPMSWLRECGIPWWYYGIQIYKFAIFYFFDIILYMCFCFIAYKYDMISNWDSSLYTHICYVILII
jgi:uncharacterized membrane protein YagU involved in acid resistance